MPRAVGGAAWRTVVGRIRSQAGSVQTMLDALRQDCLLATVRMAGVIVGVIGAGVTAPDAARAVWAAIRGAGRRWWLRLRALLRLQRSATVHPISLSARITLPGLTLSGDLEVGSPWPDTPEQQMDWLRRRTDRLGERIASVRKEGREALADLDRRVDALRDEHARDVRELRERQDEQEARDLRLNSLGLPLIGASIVLSGLPDAIARHPVVATLLLIATVVVSFAVYRAWKDARATAATT